MITKVDCVMLGWLALKLVIDVCVLIYIAWRFSSFHK